MDEAWAGLPIGLLESCCLDGWFALICPEVGEVAVGRLETALFVADIGAWVCGLPVVFCCVPVAGVCAEPRVGVAALLDAWASAGAGVWAGAED